MRQLVSTALVAAIVGALAGVTAGTLAQAEPGSAVAPAARAGNADRVDGKHAVAYTNRRGVRAGKLVATNKGGWLPSNIVQPYWGYIKNKPAVLADGQVGWNEVAGMPAGFADNIDNAGVTKVTVTRVTSPKVILPANDVGTTVAACPAGTVLVGGGANVPNIGVNLQISGPDEDNPQAWRVAYENPNPYHEELWATAFCLSVEPAGRLGVAGKRNR